MHNLLDITIALSVRMKINVVIFFIPRMQNHLLMFSGCEKKSNKTCTSLYIIFAIPCYSLDAIGIADRYP